MRIISFKKLREYFEKDKNSKVAIQEWYNKSKKADWNNFSEIKNTFNSVDSVDNSRYVFNIKGNYYRIVTLILFKLKRIYIRWVETHRDYEKNRTHRKIIKHEKYYKSSGLRKSFHYYGIIN